MAYALAAAAAQLETALFGDGLLAVLGGGVGQQGQDRGGLVLGELVGGVDLAGGHGGRGVAGHGPEGTAGGPPGHRIRGRNGHPGWRAVRRQPPRNRNPLSRYAR